MAGVPSHGLWCQSHTHPTRCRLCGAEVFFFECSCGSAVFFESLGDPWPVHDHRSLSFERKMQISIEQVGKEETERYIAQEMMAVTVDAAYGERVVRSYRRSVQRGRGRKEAAREILREDPYPGATTTEVGVVREVRERVDLVERFDLPRTDMTSALLGELGEGEYGQLTIHVNDLGEEDDFSYTFFIEVGMLGEVVEKGVLVRVGLRGVGVPERAPVWVCDWVEGV